MCGVFSHAPEYRMWHLAQMTVAELKPLLEVDRYAVFQSVE